MAQGLPADPPTLRVCGFSKSYGHRLALDGVTFSIRAGEVLGLIGPNGAGKATLFECLAGVVAPTAGAWRDGEKALEYTLGSEPGPGHDGAAPHPDLFPAANPVLQPPVKGRLGLWSKTDSTSEFKDYVVTTRPRPE